MGLIDFSESEIITWENADRSTDGTNASINFLLAALLQGLRIKTGAQITCPDGRTTVNDYTVQTLDGNTFFFEVTDDPDPTSNPRKTSQLKIANDAGIGKQYRLIGSEQINRMVSSGDINDLFE